MQKAIVLFIPRGSMPSDIADPRNRLVRSPNCPNDIRREGDEVPDETKGTCGSCAWGFYSMESPVPSVGEDPFALELTQLLADDAPMGYKAQCGSVTLYRDQSGRIGALREVEGGARFFPGDPENWAFKRYLKNNPSLKSN